MPEHDLIVVTADADAKHTLDSLLGRNRALGIRAPDYKCVRFSGRDAGCRSRVHEFLRPFINLYAHALVVFDRDGCGDDGPRTQIEADVELRLRANGWRDAAAIVIDPELEAWVWSPSPCVDEALGWSGKQPSLRAWLRERGLLAADASKPVDPKLAMESALYQARRPKSPATFAEIAGRSTIEGCVDPAFAKLLETLRKWFSVSDAPPRARRGNGAD